MDSDGVESDMQEYPTANNPASNPTAREGIHCLSCGYNPVGVAIGQRCPECGSEIMQFAGNRQQTSGKAITSLVLGIFSIITCIGYGIIGIPCGIIAIIFAKKARLAIQDGTAPASSLGMATAGRVCGWIGLILSSIYFLFIFTTIMIAIVGAAAAGAAGNAPVLMP